MTLVLSAIVLGVISFGPGASLVEQRHEPITCLRGLDPVALVRGAEQPGNEGISVVRGRYRYLFSSAANKAAFQEQPSNHEIQLGGGCGRMGPLAGLGSPDRFYVHEGRIYVFASDQCMKSFKSAPSKHIESDDAPPDGSDAALQQGYALVRHAIDGMGGVAKLDAIKTLELKRVRIYQADGEEKEQATFTRVAFPDQFRIDDIWHSGSASDFVSGSVGYRIASDGAWPMDEVVRHEFVKAMRRHPLVLLKASNEPGFRAVAAGRGMVGDQQVEWLTIGLDGGTSTLGIETTTGRVLSVRYRGRAPAAIGEVIRTFSDFRDVDGLVVPFAVATSYDNGPAGAPRAYSAISINAKIDSRLFDRPN